MKNYNLIKKANVDGVNTVHVEVGRKGRKIIVDTRLTVTDNVIFKDSMVVVTDGRTRLLNDNVAFVLNIIRGFVESPDLQDLNNSEITSLLTRRLDSVVSKLQTDVESGLHPVKKMGSSVEEFVDKNNITLVDLTDLRIKKCRATGKADALRRLVSDRKWIAKFFSDIPVLKVKKKHVVEFQRMLEKQGKSIYFSEQVIVRLKSTWKEAEENRWFNPITSPFDGFRATYKGEPQQYDLSEDEFRALVNYRSQNDSLLFVRDLFLLSFYLGGIALTELKNLNLSGEKIEYLHLANKNPNVSNPTVFRIQPEARIIIDRWFVDGDMSRCWSGHYVNGWLSKLRDELGFQNKLVMTSARRTFAHFAYKLGVNENIIKYCIGQSSFTRNVICNYIQVAEEQADRTFRAVIDYALGNTEMPDKKQGKTRSVNCHHPTFKSDFAW